MEGYKEGYIVKNEIGRYELFNNNNNYITTLTSGLVVDLWDQFLNNWITGRIEYDKNYGGYYLFKTDGRHRSLINNLKVRIGF